LIFSSEFDPDIELLDSYGDKEDLNQIFSTAKLKEWRDTPSGQASPQITDQDILDYETLITQVAFVLNGFQVFKN